MKTAVELLAEANTALRVAGADIELTRDIVRFLKRVVDARAAGMILAGRMVLEARDMTQAERDHLMWDGPELVTVFELDDGGCIFASRDEEGNGPGMLFGVDPDGADVYHYYHGEEEEEQDG